MSRFLRLLFLCLAVLAFGSGQGLDMPAAAMGPGVGMVMTEDGCGGCDEPGMAHMGASACAACQVPCAGGVMALAPALDGMEPLRLMSHGRPAMLTLSRQTDLAPPGRPPSVV